VDRPPQRFACGLLATGLALAIVGASVRAAGSAEAGPPATVATAAQSAVAGVRLARSEGGHFTLRVTGIAAPERINHLHGFDLALASADGRPVDGASIALSGQRLFAPNPLPTSPQVSPGAGPGNYRAEGLRFHMPGDWHLVFDIEVGQIHDRAILDVAVQ
jgi:hypothetical protein